MITFIKYNNIVIAYFINQQSLIIDKKENQETIKKYKLTAWRKDNSYKKSNLLNTNKNQQY